MQPPPSKRPRTGFDVLPTAAVAGSASFNMEDAKSAALAAIASLQQQLHAAGAPVQPKHRTLDEVLARDRARIAAADQRNLNYIADKQAAEKARAKSAAAAAAAVVAGDVPPPPPPPPRPDYSSSSSDPAPPPSKAPRLNAPKTSAYGSGAAAACSVYVCGLPLDVEAQELEVKMECVGPVTRVKIYRDAAGQPKGDALVTYQKDGAVIGALQLVSGTELRPGYTLKVSRPVWGGEGSSSSGSSSGGAAAATTGARAELAQKPWLEKEGAIKESLLAQAEAAANFRNAGGIAAAPKLIPGLARMMPSAASSKPPPSQQPPPPPPPTAADSEAGGGGGGGAASSSHLSDEQLRVVVVRRFFLLSEVPPASLISQRREWISGMVDELWSEACKHGEVERIAPLLDGDATHPTEGVAAIRYQSVIAAAAAVDALDGRFFCERSLAADFDEGRAHKTLPAGEDVARQRRFGFGEIAQAFQESLRTLGLASAEGAPFIGCQQFVTDLQFYSFLPNGPQGSGYYRDVNAPPPDPYEQARAILQQASDAGAAFVACAEPIDNLPMYTYRDGPEGRGYYRDAAAPLPSDPVEHSRLILREAAAAGAAYVRCPDYVGEVAGYTYLEEGAALAIEGGGYYRRSEYSEEEGREYSRMVLERASAAGADFVACAEEVMQLPGYVFRDGHEGVGFYRVAAGAAAGAGGCASSAPPPPAAAAAPAPSSFSDFMSTMRELGAV